MSQIKKITVIGCSVALRIRPPHDDRSKNYNYAQLLEKSLNENSKDLFFVENQGFSRAIIKEMIRTNSRDAIVRSAPDYVIINLGAVDAPTREIPLWFANILFQRSHFYLYRPIHFIYNSIIKNYLRKPLVYLRLQRSWTSKSKFNRDLKTLCTFLKKDTRAKIIVLGINKGNARIEKELPGTIARYESYNKLLKSHSEQFGFNFIDVSDLNSNEHFPDGVHYNSHGHKIIAERIQEIINTL